VLREAECAMTRTRLRRSLALGTVAVLLLGGACSDEDNDGGVTDEEIQDLEDAGESIGDEIEEEVDAQDEGSNDNNN
jgi:hypothetical protein